MAIQTISRARTATVRGTQKTGSLRSLKHAGAGPSGLRFSGPRPNLMNAGSRPSDERFVLKAQANDELDFDKFLAIVATKWDESENKGLVVGYTAAATFLFFFTEWFIHLPVFDLILGFPIQLLGVLAAPVLGVRWFVEKKDWFEDVSSATTTVVDALPGLKKTE